jgi:hypothetical protein
MKFFILLLTLSLIGCETTNQPNSPITPFYEDDGFHGFRNCSEVVEPLYSYIDHQFQATVLLDRCHVANDFGVTIVMTGEYAAMDRQRIPSQGGEAWLFSYDFYYNPADVEIDVIPHKGEAALGAHGFDINCLDDDEAECEVIHTYDISYDDFN